MYRYKLVRNLFQKFGFPFFTEGYYNINLFGVRAKRRESNEFNDLICMLFNTPAGWYSCSFPATTDPGKTVLGSKMGTRRGTAVLPASTVFGASQYKFTLGIHKKSYPALVQAEPFTIVRDTNKDGSILSVEQVKKKLFNRESEKGFFGINLHHAAKETVVTEVNDWSWGCQVIQLLFDWEKFFFIIEKSARVYGKTFTYTLFNEEDLEEVLGASVSSFHKIMNDNRLVD